ncbi:GNAT family N-acetyltransferase [Candidatus Micrarchaeota archaeon]|nr:GNAT family N-acetyltransferase [Candidatus Micrarchaeota archaeon]
MEEKATETGRVARTRKIAEATVDGKKVVVEELLHWSGDFQGEPVIQVRELQTGNLVAYAGFRTREGHMLAKTGSEWVELSQLSVAPAYRGQGIGSELLRLVVQLAKKSNVPLYLHPQAIGDRRLSSDELRSFYARHGFRPFTRGEVLELTRRVEMNHIKRNLLFNGFQHQTRHLTGPPMPSPEPKQLKAMDRYSDEELIRLWREHLNQQHHTDESLQANWNATASDINQHMPLAELTNAERPTRFNVRPSYRLPNTARVKVAWRRIHAAGKKPTPKHPYRPRI